MKRLFVALMLCLVSIMGFGQNPFAVSLDQAKERVFYYMLGAMRDTSTLEGLSTYCIDSLSFPECETFIVNDSVNLWYCWNHIDVAYVYFDYGEGGAAIGSHHKVMTAPGLIVAADKRMKPVYEFPEFPYRIGWDAIDYVRDCFYDQQKFFCRDIYKAYYNKLNALERTEEDSTWSNLNLNPSVVWEDIWSTLAEPIYLDTLYADTLYIDVHDTVTVHDTIYIYLDSLGIPYDGWSTCKNIEAYPNPTIGTLNIQGCFGESIEVIDNRGEVLKVIENASDNESIDLRELRSGTYFIRTSRKTIKVIKI